MGVPLVYWRMLSVTRKKTGEYEGVPVGTTSGLRFCMCDADKGKKITMICSLLVPSGDSSCEVVGLCV